MEEILIVKTPPVVFGVGGGWSSQKHTSKLNSQKRRDKTMKINKYVDIVENVIGRELTITEIIDLGEGLESSPLGVDGFLAAFIEQIY